jgi:hypothetical protein
MPPMKKQSGHTTIIWAGTTNNGAYLTSLLGRE